MKFKIILIIIAVVIAIILANNLLGLVFKTKNLIVLLIKILISPFKLLKKSKKILFKEPKENKEERIGRKLKI